MPGFWLKRQILLNLPCENLESHVANSIDFMVERVSGIVDLAWLGHLVWMDDWFVCTAGCPGQKSAGVQAHSELH